MKSELRRPGTETSITVALDRVRDDGVERYAGSVGEQAVDVEVVRDGRDGGWLRLGGRLLPFRAVRRDDTIEVWVAGRRVVLELVPRTAQRASGSGAAGAASDLAAPMPGKVLAIRAAAGDAFDAHAPLVIMESMKMEMSLSSPRAGRVREVLCREGELVAMGDLLVRLEPAVGTGDDG